MVNGKSQTPAGLTIHRSRFTIYGRQNWKITHIGGRMPLS
jgi:hypothetical protein